MPSDIWYCLTRGGKMLGPFSLAQIQQLVGSGMLLTSDSLRNADGGDWVGIDRIDGLVITDGKQKEASCASGGSELGARQDETVFNSVGQTSQGAVLADTERDNNEKELTDLGRALQKDQIAQHHEQLSRLCPLIGWTSGSAIGFVLCVASWNVDLSHERWSSMHFVVLCILSMVGLGIGKTVAWCIRLLGSISLATSLANSQPRLERAAWAGALSGCLAGIFGTLWYTRVYWGVIGPVSSMPSGDGTLSVIASTLLMAGLVGAWMGSAISTTASVAIQAVWQPLTISTWIGMLAVVIVVVLALSTRPQVPGPTLV